MPTIGSIPEFDQFTKWIRSLRSDELHSLMEGLSQCRTSVSITAEKSGSAESLIKWMRESPSIAETLAAVKLVASQQLPKRYSHYLLPSPTIRILPILGALLTCVPMCMLIGILVLLVKNQLTEHGEVVSPLTFPPGVPMDLTKNNDFRNSLIVPPRYQSVADLYWLAEDLSSTENAHLVTEMNALLDTLLEKIHNEEDVFAQRILILSIRFLKDAADVSISARASASLSELETTDSRPGVQDAIRRAKSPFKRDRWPWDKIRDLDAE